MDSNVAVAQYEELDGLRKRCAELERELDARRAAQQRRLSIAADVHRSLLPGPVRHNRIWADVRYIPIEEVGGDYCQIRFPDRATCYITMCDVMGHGTGAALLATRVSSEVRYGITYGREPRDIVRSLERFMQEHFSHTGLFLTFLAAMIDFDRMELTWSGAGHPSPFVLRPQNDEPLYLRAQNSVVGLGITDDDAFGQDSLPLQVGDRLFFFTDGLFEVLDAEERQLGIQGFTEIAKATMGHDLFEVADDVLERVREYEHGPNTDDQPLIVAEIR
jgi:sigma-B regulation protein RsbU (phosphoserine phosphatase)